MKTSGYGYVNYVSFKSKSKIKENFGLNFLLCWLAGWMDGWMKCFVIVFHFSTTHRTQGNYQ